MPSQDDIVYFNGINGATGEYGVPPLPAASVADWALQQASPVNLDELQNRRTQPGARHLGVKEGVDPNNLAEAGWGVIFAHDADPALKEALGELLTWRREQAGARFRLYEGPEGLQTGERKGLFLARRGAMAGPVDPAIVPYYLLLVGDPVAIPFEFQYELDVQYAVGRIDFATLDEYASYAHSVVLAEQTGPAAARRACFVGVSHPDDGATRVAAAHLIEPLANAVRTAAPDWQVATSLHAAARKAHLVDLVSGPVPPALLVTASHGLEFPLGDAQQLRHQGALLCADWPGPHNWTRGKRITPDYYFSGDDLAAEANLHGLIALMFACYSGGTPLLDDGARPGAVPQALAPQPFVASLPRRMLGHPRGGALAVVSHVARSSSYSFGWPGVGPQITVFQSCLERLLRGYTVGAAVEFFNERWAELATMLHQLRPQVDAGWQVSPTELAGLWLAGTDARNYIVLGDPAVRVAASSNREQPEPAVHVSSPQPASAPPAAVQTAPVPTARLVTIPDELDEVVVSTYATPDPDQPATRVLKARTVVSLTGEVLVFLPTSLTEADEPYLAMHRSAVQQALATRLAILGLLDQPDTPADVTAEPGVDT